MKTKTLKKTNRVITHELKHEKLDLKSKNLMKRNQK